MLDIVRVAIYIVVVLSLATCKHRQTIPPERNDCAHDIIPILSFKDSGQVLGLNTSTDDVLKALGSPKSQAQGDWFCQPSATERVEGESRVLNYSGLSVTMVKERGSDAFNIFALIVTDERYLLANGLRVGSRRDQIIATLGSSQESKGNDGVAGDGDVLTYVLNSCGHAIMFQLKQGIVVKITVTSWC